MSRSGGLRDPEIRAHRLPPAGFIPNSHLPLIEVRRVLDPTTADLAAAFEGLAGLNGWPPAWRNGIYEFPHFHSVCHEALAIACGRARVRFGGEPGIVLELGVGDATVLPAGTGHQALWASPDLLVIGAYPAGSPYDLRRGRPEELAAVLEAIALVPCPATDPFLGRSGGVARLWCPDSTASAAQA